MTNQKNKICKKEVLESPP